ncbi:unnamed protein product [Clonostachys rhizophaga]|uniref:Uncharacterized protein n=1 Tax=Clonostachys rhizophaga TaxID=160324 RepID=A0A9N9VQ54_9HYPO|nr:unnamed protein product [Clonostachys rhizophaga]
MCEDNTLSGPGITNSAWSVFPTHWPVLLPDNDNFTNVTSRRSHGQVYLLRYCLVSIDRISRTDYVVDNEYILAQRFDNHFDRNAISYRISSTNDLHKRPPSQKYIGSRLRF